MKMVRRTAVAIDRRGNAGREPIVNDLFRCLRKTSYIDLPVIQR